MSISAILKKHGFSCDLLLASEEKNLKKTVLKRKPLVLGFIAITGEHHWVLDIAKKAKKEGLLTLLGGPHPTYYPEVIKEEGVDMIVRGEGEEAILELLTALKNKKDYTKIQNLWVKKNGQIYQNEMRPLIHNLDDLPDFDREIYYDKYDFLRKVSVKQFLTSRGCPYSCTFCANNLLRKTYLGKGKYLRRRSPQKVIEEILNVRKKYGLRAISFTDDNFVSDKMWLSEFLPLYKKEINLPFMCNVTANLVTDQLISNLKKAGCYGVSMGVESGNEKLRFEVLKKYITNEQILNAGKIIKKYELVLKTYNILCLPGESLENAFETVLLNAAIKPDHTSCSLLQPYPKYEIAEEAIKKGYLSENFGVDDIADSIYRTSPIQCAHKKELENLQTFFFLCVKFPKLIPLVRRLIKLPSNGFYRLLAQAFYGFYMSRVHRLTFSDMMRYALHVDAFKV